MNISIPTTWKNSFIDEIDNINKLGINKVTELYGSLPISQVGSARPPLNLPEISLADMKKHINYINARGYTFNYLMNSPQILNINKKVVRHVSQIIKILGKHNTITIAHRELAQLVQNISKGKIKMVASMVLDIQGLQEIGFWQEKGVSRIVLSNNVNRNIALLKSILKNTNVEIQLLANETCLINCPNKLRHYHMAGINSLQSNKNQQFQDNLMLECTYRKLRDLSNLIKSGWIRPEDLWLYENSGLKHIKLGDRTKNASWLLNCAQAYTLGKSPKNFMDILAITPHNFTAASKNKKLLAKFPKIFINNKKLNRFTQKLFSHNIDCRYACPTCRLCESIAKKAIIVENSALEQYCRAILKALKKE